MSIGSLGRAIHVDCHTVVGFGGMRADRCHELRMCDGHVHRLGGGCVDAHVGILRYGLVLVRHGLSCRYLLHCAGHILRGPCDLRHDLRHGSLRIRVLLRHLVRYLILWLWRLRLAGHGRLSGLRLGSSRHWLRLYLIRHGLNRHGLGRHGGGRSLIRYWLHCGYCLLLCECIADR